MSEQDDLFNKDAEQIPDELSDNEITAVEESVAGLAPNEMAPKAVIGVGQGIATEEIRVVDPPTKQKSSPALLFVLLILVVLFGAGYFLIDGLSEMPLPMAENQVKKSVPKRYAIDKNVEVEVVEQQQVAAITQPKVAASKPATVVAPVKKADVPVTNKIKQVGGNSAAPQYQVMVGPFLSKVSAESVAKQLLKLGYTAEMSKGRGPVSMTRLLEGVYPLTEARERLKTVKKLVGDAFMLPIGDKWAIYVGSFTDPERAAKYVDKLLGKGVNVTPVVSEVEMNGRMLIAAQKDQQGAKGVAAQISSAGFTAQVKKK